MTSPTPPTPPRRGPKRNANRYRFTRDPIIWLIFAAAVAVPTFELARLVRAGKRLPWMSSEPRRTGPTVGLPPTVAPPPTPPASPAPIATPEPTPSSDSLSLAAHDPSVYTAVGPTATPVIAAVLSHRGDAAAVLEESGLVTFWDVRLHKQVSASATPLPMPKGGFKRPPSMAMAPPVELTPGAPPGAKPGAVVAVVGGDGGFHVWYGGDGGKLFTSPRKRSVVDVALISGRTMVSSVASDGAVGQWTAILPPESAFMFAPPRPGGNAVVDLDGNVDQPLAAAATTRGVYIQHRNGSPWTLVDSAAARPTKVLMSPDNRLLASAWDNGEVRVHSLPALELWRGPGAPLPPSRRLRVGRTAEKSAPWLLAFSDDGALLAASGAGRTVYVWSTAEDKPPVHLAIPRGPVRSLWFAPNSHTLVVAAAGDRFFRRHDLPSVQLAGSPAPKTAPAQLPAGPLQPLAADPAPVVAPDPTLDRKSAKRVLGPASAEIAAAAVSPDGRFAAILDDLGEVTVWDTRSRKQIGAFPSGQRLPMNFFGGPPLAITNPAAGGELPVLVLTGDNAGYVRARTVHGKPFLVGAHGVGRYVRSTTDTSVTDVALAAEGVVVAASSERIGLWKPSAPAASTVRWANPTPTERIWDVDVSPDGYTIAAATEGGLYFLSVRAPMWGLVDTSGVESMAQVHARVQASGSGGRRPGHAAGRVRFSPGGDLVATACDGGEIRVYSVRERRRLYTLRHGELPGWMRKIAFSDDGALLAATDGNRVIQVWSMADGSPAAAVTAPTSSIKSLWFEPDKRGLVVSLWRDRYLHRLELPASVATLAAPTPSTSGR